MENLAPVGPASICPLLSPGSTSKMLPRLDICTRSFVCLRVLLPGAHRAHCIAFFWTWLKITLFKRLIGLIPYILTNSTSSYLVLLKIPFNMDLDISACLHTCTIVSVIYLCPPTGMLTPETELFFLFNHGWG